MSKLSYKLLIVTCFLVASSTTFALDFVKFGTSHDTGAFWGEADYEFAPFPSTLDYLATNGHTQINPLSTTELTDADVADVFNGSEGAFDALVVSESIQTLSAASYTRFENYVNGGGCLIVTGDHGDNEDTFLNSVFGYGMAATDANDGVDTFAIQASTAGSAFAGGPSPLLASNASALFSGTPGAIMYSGVAGDGVFAVNQGLGTVVGISYDYCCTDAPITTEQNILDWYEIANRSFAQCELNAQVSPVPAASHTSLIIAASMLSLFGFIAIRRRYSV